MTRSKKSVIEANGPCMRRSSMMAFAMSLPKFLMVKRPKRMMPSPGVFELFTTVKSAWLAFISGGWTVMPIFTASLMISAIFSVSPDSAVRMAQMYSTGKLAFM